MGTQPETIKKKLRKVGYSQEIVDAAWPSWWSQTTEMHPGTLQDLKYSLERKLAISADSLFDEGNTIFVWKGEAKFKRLSTQSDAEGQILTSFGLAIGKLLIDCHAPPTVQKTLQDADSWAIRKALLEGGAKHVGIAHILGLARALGIPVACVKVFPLAAKRMAAMTVRVGDRYAILIGKDSLYSAPIAFYIAHELGHIARGHLPSESALIDAEIETADLDAEEQEADSFALELLTGRSAIQFDLNRPPENPAELANAAVNTAGPERIDPGILVMCYGHSSQQWQLATATLKVLYGSGKPAWLQINRQIIEALALELISDDQRDFLLKVLGMRPITPDR